MNKNLSGIFFRHCVVPSRIALMIATFACGSADPLLFENFDDHAETVTEETSNVDQVIPNSVIEETSDVNVVQEIEQGEDQINSGGVLPTGLGINRKGGGILVPNDRVHHVTFTGQVEELTIPELTSMRNSLVRMTTLTSFELIDDGTDEVNVVIDPKPASEVCKGNKRGTCWLGSASFDKTGENFEVDGSSIFICEHYTINISIENIRAFARQKIMRPENVLMTVLMHELGHTLGLPHGKEGLMKSAPPNTMLKDPGNIVFQEVEIMRLNAFETNDSGIWNVIAL